MKTYEEFRNDILLSDAFNNMTMKEVENAAALAFAKEYAAEKLIYTNKAYFNLKNEKQKIDVKYLKWFIIFYDKIKAYKYYIDLDDSEQMRHANELYDLDMSPEDAAWDYVSENNRQD